MPKPVATEPSRIAINPALLALKPRQVLISMAKESNKAQSLKSEQKTLVLRSIAQYLERCGFSKCFKKFLSEAQIEKKELNSALPDLEEAYGLFFNKSNLQAVEVKDESVYGEEKKAEVKKEKKKVEVTKEEKVKETNGEIGDLEVKEKNKKKKKNKSKATEADEENVSKKRKRSEPEEDGDDEESKRMKKEDDMSVQEIPVKQIEEENGSNVEKSETESTNNKSNSKERKKPFQRVNVEEVVFTDDRLKDNSYWAKGGADLGYGAKAQEVLGQVRGRGFRHEKTKKKRGSYRGGEIDLQSHSVKFEYSDEE